MRKRWGWSLVLLRGKHFKVKLLYFKEGGSISMQRHKHRVELWLCVFGEGKMVIDHNTPHTLMGGYCARINENQWHQFTAKTPTLVLEIQTGKCKESDIERAK